MGIEGISGQLSGGFVLRRGSHGSEFHVFVYPAFY